MRFVRWLALASLCSAAPLSVRAEVHSVSYSDWTIGAEIITLKFVLPESEAQRLTGVGVPLLTVKKLSDYLLEHAGVTADGEECPAIDQGYDIGLVDPLAVGAGSYGLEVFFRCAKANPSELVLMNSMLFALVPTHVNFARIRKDGQFVPQVFTAARREIRVPSAGPSPAGIGSYLPLGFRHVLGSLDRICVLLGLLWLVRRRAELGYILAGLALGYALAAVAALADWIAPRPHLLESFVGVIAVLLAAEMVARGAASRVRVTAGAVAILLVTALVALVTVGWASALVLLGGAFVAGSLLPTSETLAQRPGFWLASAGVVGFVDGFVLPPAVAPLQLQNRALLTMLSGFDAGALLAAALVVVIAAGGAALLRARRFVPPLPVLNDVAAAALGGLGAFWLASRLYA